jgi:probable F420-dependent oxidoreductase
MDVDFIATGRRLGQVQDLARDASRVGFSGIVFAEAGRTAYLSVAAAALATDDLELGTGIAVAFPRSPMVTAQVAWELADVSGGRFALGLGTQVKAHIERRYSSEFDHPGPRLKEYVQAVRAIFAAFQGAERLHFEGEFYRFSLLPPAWSPGPIDHPDVPIYVSAVGPWMLRMAGEVADGIHVHPFHSRAYLDDVLRVRVAEGAARAGRDPAQVRLAVPVFTIVGDTEEERRPWRDQARAQIAFYGSTKNYAFQFDRLGYEGTSARLNEKLKAGDTAGMAALITDDMLAHYAVEASWDELSDRLVERYGDVADRLVLYFAEAARRRDPRSFARLGEAAADVRGRTEAG